MVLQQQHLQALEYLAVQPLPQQLLVSTNHKLSMSFGMNYNLLLPITIYFTQVRSNNQAHCSHFDWKTENLEKRKSIFQSGKSQGILIRWEKSGNFTRNTEKSEIFDTVKLEQNTGKVREFCQPEKSKNHGNIVSHFK